MIKIALALALSTTAPLPVKTEKNIINDEAVLFMSMLIAVRTCGAQVSEPAQAAIAAAALSVSRYDNGSEFARAIAYGASVAAKDAFAKGQIVPLCDRLRAIFGGL